MSNPEAPPKVPQSRAELEEHLGEQVGFLRKSAAMYDGGDYAEAKRIATALRTLLHHHRQSRALLAQLDRLGGSFISTSIPDQPGNQSPHNGLVFLGDVAERAYVAPLDQMPFVRWMPFVEWWHGEIVVRDDRGDKFTRKDLVLSVADQDGGTHVDPALSEPYARLSRENSLRWTKMPSGAAVAFPERASVRQIGHEVMRTLDPDYRCRPPANRGGMFSLAMTFDIGGSTPVTTKSSKHGRNEQCPCGSGQKYKRCHGKIVTSASTSNS